MFLTSSYSAVTVDTDIGIHLKLDQFSKGSQNNRPAP